MREELRRQWLGGVLGLLAVFIALGGPAAAADVAASAKKLVTGKQIKNRTITKKDISRKAIRSLRGKLGPVGPAGPTGAVGPTGSQGAQGLQGIEGPQGPTGETGPAGPKGDPGVAPDNVIVEGDPAGGGLTGTFPNPTIASNAVGTAQLANDSVVGDKIADNAVSSPQIALGAVGADEIFGGAVGTAELATSAVTTAKINDSAVTGIKIATNSVDTAELVSGSVGISELNSGNGTGTFGYTYNPGSIAAGTCFDVDLNEAAAQPGQLAIATPGNAQTNGLYIVPTVVQTAGKVWLRICNGSGGAIDPNNMTFGVTLVD